MVESSEANCRRHYAGRAVVFRSRAAAGCYPCDQRSGEEAGKPRWDWQPEAVNDALNARVAALSVESRLSSDAYRIVPINKNAMLRLHVIKPKPLSSLLQKMKPDANELGEILHAIEKKRAAAYRQASCVLMAVKKT